MKTSDKIKNIINDQISEDITSACEREGVSNFDYGELLDILVEVSKLEVMNQSSF